jgi:hypothetical protein
MDSTELGVPATFFSPSPLSANRDPPAAPDSLKIQRAAHRPAAALEDVGVDHGGADVFMPEEFLDSADIIAGRWVAKEWRRVLGCLANGALQGRGVYGWRSFLPLRGSMARREAGKRYCQPSSREALGNFMASASGR